MISSLTQNAIDFLINNSNPNQEYIIQILEQPDFIADGLYKTQFSDGFSKCKKGYLVGEASSTCQELKKFDIIKCQRHSDENVKDKDKIIISSYEIVYSNITEIIGNPIDYKNYKQAGLKNPEGSALIPQKFCNKNTQVFQKNQENQQKLNNQQQNNKNQNASQQKQPNTQAANRVSQNPNTLQKQNQVYQDDEKNLETIKQLAPNCLGNFKARVVKKGELKTITAQGKETSCFSIDVIDNEGYEVTIQFFGDQATKFNSVIESGSVFIFRNTLVKLNMNKQYNKGDHVVTFNKDSTVTKTNDDGSLPKIKLNKKYIANIQGMNKNDPLDIVCIVKEISESAQKSRRDVIVYDESSAETEVVLWGDNAEKCDAQAGDILVFKDARIGEFNQKKQINISFGSEVYVRPDPKTFPEVNDLKEWVKKQSDQNLSNLQRVGAIREQNMNLKVTTHEQSLSMLKQENGEQEGNLDENYQVWKEVRAQILFVKEKDTMLYYNSCTKCKRKAHPNQGGTWSCSNFQCEQYLNEPDCKFIVTFLIGDSSDTMWVNTYNDVAEQIFDKKAKQFRDAQDNVDELKSYIQVALNKEYRFLLLSKAERIPNDNRLFIKTIIQSIKETKPNIEAKKILNSIDKCLELL